MQIMIDGHPSSPVSIQRGSPQGSVLGCLLYCVTTQGLTKRLREARGMRGFFPQDSSDDEGVRFWDGGEMEEARPAVFMYVDDTTLVDVVPIAGATLHVSTAATRARLENLEIERDFAELNTRAEQINMKINAKKTQLLAIAPPAGYDVTAAIDVGDDQIVSVDNLKLVGFTFGRDPGVGAHVKAIEERSEGRSGCCTSCAAPALNGGSYTGFTAATCGRSWNTARWCIIQC